MNIASKLLGGVGAVAGLALGGGIGMAGLKVLGGMAARSLATVRPDGMTNRQALASGNKFSRMRLKALEASEKGTFDARNTRLGKLVGDKVFETNQKGISTVGSFGQREKGKGFTADVKKQEDYFKSISDKLGNPSDKDPVKAAAARTAFGRFIEQMDKGSTAFHVSENIQQGSLYHNLLKKVAGGGTAPAGVILSKDDASKNLAAYEKQARAESRDAVAKGFVTAKRAAQAKVAQKAVENIEKAAKTEEAGERTKAKRDSDEASYTTHKEKLDAYTKAYAPENATSPTRPADYDIFQGVFVTPVNITPAGYSDAAERSLEQLTKQADILTRDVKRLSGDRERIEKSLSDFKIESIKATDRHVKGPILEEMRRMEGKRDTVMGELNTKQQNLDSFNTKIGEMKKLSQKGDAVSKYAKDDRTELLKPADSSK
jgi:hypothetical protein